MGFEFGEVAQMTDEWENRFDQLLEWMLWNREEVCIWLDARPCCHKMVRAR